MNGTLLSAEMLYADLYKELKPKARKSLSHVKGACDQIVLTRGTMNYSRVAAVAVKLYGGPKPQTIQNNPRLKRYIDRRRDEYLRMGKSSSHTSAIALKAHRGNYPSEKLDLKTRVYIDLLIDRLNFVEARYKALQEWQERSTKANPIDLAAAIGRGPNGLGSLDISVMNSNVAYIDSLKEALRSLLLLPEHIGNLRISELKGKKKLVLLRPSGDVIVLTPSQYEAVEWILSMKSGPDISTHEEPVANKQAI